ncbi:MAG: MATE family efflux transporter [Oscillospiraceae bacterium]|jgi:putative MATE family efflux protein|nr:MATE family efflux transporter [Oscillospiraceae bacterium]
MTKRIKGLFGTQDLTEGNILLGLTKFVIPLLIGSIAQMLYTTVDAMIVGNFMGEKGDQALAAIGASMPIQNLFLVFVMAIGMGVMTMAAQYYGAKDYDSLALTIGNSITLILIFSVIISAVATPLTPAILRLTATPSDSFALAEVYLKILFLGTIGNGFYNVLSGILRAVGDSVFPLLILLGTVILNTGLDILFVAGFGWGTMGAAWATVISQVLSSAVCLIKVLRMKNIVNIRFDMLRLKRGTVAHITRLGLPTGVSMAIMFLSNLITQPLINRMGYMVMAAMTATMRVDGFALLPSQSFSMAAGTFTGQNIGAGRMDRVKKGSITVFLMCLVFSAVMVGAILLFGRHIFELFTQTEELINMGMSFIWVMVPAYLVMAANMSYQGVMRGAGDSIGTMWISILINVLMKVPLTYLIVHLTKSEVYPNGNPKSMFYAMLICMLVGCVITMLYYRLGKWKTKSIIHHDAPAADAL